MQASPTPPSPQHPAASSVSLLRFRAESVLIPSESREGSSSLLPVAATLLACKLGDGTSISEESEDKALTPRGADSHPMHAFQLLTYP